MNHALRNWRYRWVKETLKQSHPSLTVTSEAHEYAYCRMKTECQGKHKLLKRGTKKKELLYVLCLNPEGCNQKTFYPQKIDTTKEERQV